MALDSVSALVHAWDIGSGACHTVFADKKGGHQQIIAICPTQAGAVDYDSAAVAANARLIAAAPDLLFVVNEIVDSGIVLPLYLQHLSNKALNKAIHGAGVQS